MFLLLFGSVTHINLGMPTSIWIINFLFLFLRVPFLRLYLIEHLMCEAEWSVCSTAVLPDSLSCCGEGCNSAKHAVYFTIKAHLASAATFTLWHYLQRRFMAVPASISIKRRNTFSVSEGRGVTGGALLGSEGRVSFLWTFLFHITSTKELWLAKRC